MRSWKKSFLTSVPVRPPNFGTSKKLGRPNSTVNKRSYEACKTVCKIGPRIPFEPKRPKKYLWTIAHSEDLNQPAQRCSLFRVFFVCTKKRCILGYQNAVNEDSDQTARMRRLIWIFAGRTFSKVRCDSFFSVAVPFMFNQHSTVRKQSDFHFI